MGISDMIALFIHETLEGRDGFCELQRTELAQRFSCVPSQINYVITTRFSPEHGYFVESRRGGGGYIRIRRIQTCPTHLLMHTVNAVGERIDLQTVKALLSNLRGAGLIDQTVANLIAAAVGENALRGLPHEIRNSTRASIFKQMLAQIRQEE